jgi:hypothetical protein
MWSFAGISFDIFDGGPIYDEWFGFDLVHTAEVGLGGQQAGPVGVGGVTAQLLSVTAQTSVRATRDSLVALFGRAGALLSDDGRSCTALLVGATPVRVVSTTSGVYRAKLTFRYISG